MPVVFSYSLFCWVVYLQQWHKWSGWLFAIMISKGIFTFMRGDFSVYYSYMWSITSILIITHYRAVVNQIWSGGMNTFTHAHAYIIHTRTQTCFFGTYSIISACTSQNNIYIIIGNIYCTPLLIWCSFFFFFHFWSSTVSHYGKKNSELYAIHHLLS